MTPTLPGGAPLRVLIVDDSAFMRASLRHIVGNTPGFTVAGEANDGLTGVEAIRSLRPDIVTLDIDMPGLDGIGVLKKVRASAGLTERLRSAKTGAPFVSSPPTSSTPRLMRPAASSLTLR